MLEATMSFTPLFSDRTDAGEQLAKSILVNLQEPNSTGIDAKPIIYALPRGGIPIAVPVAHLLSCPVDIVVAKKITMPQNPELAVGAVTSLGQVIWAKQRIFGNNSKLLERIQQQAQAKAAAQMAIFASRRPQVTPQGAIALLIDDGIATGMTIAAATLTLKAQNPAQIWICAPLAPPSLLKWLTRWSDRVIILETPDPFYSVSRFYQEFPQVDTEDALIALTECNLAYVN
jgi:putative phosphoribosyl transferase